MAGRPDDPRAWLEAALGAAGAAWPAVTPGSEVPTPLPQGTMDADAAAGAAALDAAVHAWDIAVATGQPAALTTGLAARLMPVAASIVEPLRGYGAYAAALPPQPGDDAGAALLRYLGRQPAGPGNRSSRHDQGTRRRPVLLHRRVRGPPAHRQTGHRGP